MKKSIKFLSMLFMTMFMCLPMASCSDDDGEANSSDAKYDFSVIWSVVDRGDYSVSEAQSLAASFTRVGEDMIERATEKEAKEWFNEFCEDLRYELSTGYMKVTLKAVLTRNEGNKAIASKTFYIKPDGTVVNAPRPAVESAVE